MGVSCMFNVNKLLTFLLYPICLPFAVLIPSLSRVLFLEIQSISTLYFPMIPFHFYNLRVLFLVPTTNSLQCAMGIISYSHSQGSPLSSCVLSRVLSPNLITNKITILLLGRTSWSILKLYAFTWKLKFWNFSIFLIFWYWMFVYRLLYSLCNLSFNTQWICHEFYFCWVQAPILFLCFSALVWVPVSIVCTGSFHIQSIRSRDIVYVLQCIVCFICDSKLQIISVLFRSALQCPFVVILNLSQCPCFGRVPETVCVMHYWIPCPFANAPNTANETMYFMCNRTVVIIIWVLCLFHVIARLCCISETLILIWQIRAILLLSW